MTEDEKKQAELVMAIAIAALAVAHKLSNCCPLEIAAGLSSALTLQLAESTDASEETLVESFRSNLRGARALTAEQRALMLSRAHDMYATGRAEPS